MSIDQTIQENEVDPIDRPTVIIDMDRLQPADWNPRLITANEFHNLCESIRADPTFLEDRPVLANAHGIIYAGNMRWRAVKHLYDEDGWESPWGPNEIPARITDVDDVTAKTRAIQDNNSWGEWQEIELGEIINEIRDADEDRLARLGFTNEDLDDILNSIGVEDYAGSLRDTDPTPVVDGRTGRPLEDEPPATTQREPTPRSDVVVEILCSMAAFDSIKRTLDEWGHRDGVEINIS